MLYKHWRSRIPEHLHEQTNQTWHPCKMPKRLYSREDISVDFSFQATNIQQKSVNSPKTRQKWIHKKRGESKDSPLVKWSAVGETRTRTGLLPLPPQSSVSTISPPPLCLFWDCKGTTKIFTSKFFYNFCHFFLIFLQKGVVFHDFSRKNAQIRKAIPMLIDLIIFVTMEDPEK